MNSNFTIPKSCIFRNLGFCLIDHKNKKAYRFVNKESADFIRSEAYQSKISDLWIKAVHISQDDIDYPYQNNFELFEVEYINNVFYWAEMSFFDIKASLLKLCDICIYLSENGYSIQSHLWNIILQKGEPTLIDLGDFKKGANSQLVFDTIISTLRSQCEDHHCPKKLHGSSWVANYKYILDEINKLKSRINSLNAVTVSKNLKSIINNIEIKQEAHYWDTYPTQKAIPKNKEEIIQYAKTNSSLKSSNLCWSISEQKPETLIDIGCSRGLYSIYASLSHGTSCTGIDYSHDLISSANKHSRELKINNNFAFIDLLNIKKYGFKKAYESFLERFNCEMLIAPAVIHHLHGRGVPLEDIINQWCLITSKCLMIEYIAHDTLNNYIDIDVIKKCLSQNGFDNIQLLDSNREDRKWVYAYKSLNC